MSSASSRLTEVSSASSFAEHELRKLSTLSSVPRSASDSEAAVSDPELSKVGDSVGESLAVTVGCGLGRMGDEVCFRPCINRFRGLLGVVTGETVVSDLDVGGGLGTACVEDHFS